MSTPKRTLVQFRWANTDNPLDYVSIADMTEEERENVRDMLRGAEKDEQIEGGWYCDDTGPSKGATIIYDLSEAFCSRGIWPCFVHPEKECAS